MKKEDGRKKKNLEWERITRRRKEENDKCGPENPKLPTKLIRIDPKNGLGREGESVEEAESDVNAMEVLRKKVGRDKTGNLRKKEIIKKRPGMPTPPTGNPDNNLKIKYSVGGRERRLFHPSLDDAGAKEWTDNLEWETK